jgi:hypothetical protein
MMEEDNYEDTYEEETRSEDPQWRMLTPKERKLLMKKVFSNPDWYDEEAGTPVFEGGTSNPMFNEIAERVGAPVREVKRYYAAWCNARGLSPGDLLNSGSERTSSTQSTQGSSYTPPQPTALGITPIQPTPPPLSLQPPPESSSSDASGMWAMMQFLTAQQQMAMQQQQFQMQIQMDQRRLDQQRESELRRESVARDQQFMNQQMAFMRDMTKKSGDDGFFDSEFKGLMKERFADSLFGGDKDESWRDTVKEVLGSDTLKATVAGLGTAIGGMRPAAVPAGYDTPEYNPYAQQVAPKPNQSQLVQEVRQEVQEVPSGVFFSEGGEDPQQVAVERPVEQEIVQFSEDEYKKILFSAFTEAMGPAVNDPKVVQALQSQVEVAVQTTIVEMPEALPNIKLQAMNEKLLLIRNLRDLGMGLMDLRSRTAEGQQPSPLLVSAVVGELRKNPEFYKIFATNTYDELMANIEPFKNTGAVRQDYEYLLQPGTQAVCRPKKKLFLKATP